MVKCPFCSYANEDGALFCEQCKSDLTSGTAGLPAPIPMAMPEPMEVEILEASVNIRNASILSVGRWRGTTSGLSRSVVEGNFDITLVVVW